MNGFVLSFATFVALILSVTAICAGPRPINLDAYGRNRQLWGPDLALNRRGEVISNIGSGLTVGSERIALSDVPGTGGTVKEGQSIIAAPGPNPVFRHSSPTITVHQPTSNIHVKSPTVVVRPYILHNSPNVNVRPTVIAKGSKPTVSVRPVAVKLLQQSVQQPSYRDNVFISGSRPNSFVPGYAPAQPLAPAHPLAPGFSPAQPLAPGYAPGFAPINAPAFARALPNLRAHAPNCAFNAWHH